MTDNLKIGENRIEDIRNPDGTFKKGTQVGRMKKKGFTLTDLNKVVIEYEKTHELPILKHYIEQLYKDNTLLGKYIDKNVPTKQEFEFIIPKVVHEVEFVQKGEPPEIKEEEK